MDRDLSFFTGVHQVTTDFAGAEAKVPVFYYDGSAITAIFAARMGCLKAMMPRSDYHPLPLLPGVGAIAVTCFNYRDTDIQPYNEISVSIPMSFKCCPGFYGVKAIQGLLQREFHVYIHRLPVTTQIALDGGVFVYNYPKFLARIDFEQTPDGINVLLEEDGELILALWGRAIAADQSRRVRFVTYPVKEGFAQHADVLMNARQFGMSVDPSAARLMLGKRHPMARELQEAILLQRPIVYQYMPSFQAILYGPNRLE